MDYDFKTAQWKRDIDSFSRWKPWVERLKDRDDDFAKNFCARTRAWMRDIQQRWPQFIKEDEIP